MIQKISKFPLDRFLCHSCSCIFESECSSVFFCSPTCELKGPASAIIDAFEIFFSPSLHGKPIKDGIDTSKCLRSFREIINQARGKDQALYEKVVPLNQRIKERQEVALEVFNQYLIHGTLDSVGKIRGVTRERIRQILIRGNNENLFIYPIPEIKISSKEISEAIEATLTRQQAAARLGITTRRLCDLIYIYNINPEAFNISNNYYRRLRTKNWYDNVVVELGHHPSTTELHNTRKYRPNYASVCRLWGNFRNFRMHYGITESNLNINLYLKEMRSERKLTKNYIINCLTKHPEGMSSSEVYVDILTSDIGSLRGKYRLTRKGLPSFHYISGILMELSKFGQIYVKGNGKNSRYYLKESDEKS